MPELQEARSGLSRTSSGSSDERQQRRHRRRPRARGCGRSEERMRLSSSDTTMECASRARPGAATQQRKRKSMSDYFGGILKIRYF